DPLAETRDLMGRKPLAALCGGHPLARIGRQYAADQFAGFRLAGHNGLMPLMVGRGSLGRVETQLSLALLRVRSVARKTVFRKNRAGLAIEINSGWRLCVLCPRRRPSEWAYRHQDREQITPAELKKKRHGARPSQ